MSEPNLPMQINFSNHGQEEGVNDLGLLEGKRKGFDQTFRGRGRKNIAQQGSVPEGAGRFNESDPNT